MDAKRGLYEGFFERMQTAKDAGFNLEASWYCYAMIEDRLLSMLRNSGGAGRNGSAEPIRMLGEKLAELQRRSSSNALLKSCLPDVEINEWKDKRNDLMHAMAAGVLSIPEIDKEAYLLSQSGQTLLKKLSAGAMRLKKHSAKVPS